MTIFLRSAAKCLRVTYEYVCLTADTNISGLLSLVSPRLTFPQERRSNSSFGPRSQCHRYSCRCCCQENEKRKKIHTAAFFACSRSNHQSNIWLRFCITVRVQFFLSLVRAFLISHVCFSSIRLTAFYFFSFYFTLLPTNHHYGIPRARQS